MKNIKNIDCTLRDGGNLNNWHFSNSEVETIITGLDQAKIDIIEIGYKGGSSSNKHRDVGAAARCDTNFIEKLPSLENSMYAIMISPNSKLKLNIIDEIDKKKIRWIRIASYPKNVSIAFPFIEYAKSHGFKVSMNLMGASKISPSEILKIAQKGKSSDVDLFCIADSFGSMIPEQIKEIFKLVLENVNIVMGFHGHNNLGLALTNTLTAIDAGATYIDTSLNGMARGAGNLPTEQFVPVITKIDRISKYQNQPILETAEYLLEEVLDQPMRIAKAEILCGINDLHYYYFDIIDKVCKENNYDLYNFAELLSKKTATSVDKEKVDEVAKIIEREKLKYEN
ncbi:aldolase [Salipaludibacillus sp. LMS25]|jgi:4-hydroxy 2-oxovalerate aldolase|uniref:aldolase n=1 Tax=Salipaludibacillus sp. LMS25 TaxID=2924031 RepID=UPI0020D0E1FE|nr:aldolase [Salipaludibacillus sp. LMS25]UTR15954.1 aldolase [Salipaludibacillus sp. LMS25]